MLTRFSFDLAWWPSFWPHLTQFQIWLRNHQDKHGKIHDDCFKNVTSRVLTRSSFDLAWWPSFFYSKWPSFKLDLDLIKTNILSKIHDDCFINVTTRVLTRFYTDVARWPSSWPHMTQFWTWPRNHQDKHYDQDSWWLLQKCDR